MSVTRIATSATFQDNGNDSGYHNVDNGDDDCAVARYDHYDHDCYGERGNKRLS